MAARGRLQENHMRHMIKSLLFALLACAAALAQQQGCGSGAPYFPWEKSDPKYQAYSFTIDDGGILHKTPISGVGMDLRFAQSFGTGHHDHETTAYPRPNGYAVSGTYLQSGTDGYAYFYWQHPNISGWGTFTVIPRDVRFPTQCNNHYFGLFTYDSQGNKYPLTPLYHGGHAMAYSLHYDQKHEGQDRYGTFRSVRSVDSLLVKFETMGATLNPAHLLLDVVRGSCPDGGICDSEFINPPYSQAEGADWQTRAAEHHDLGVEWDIANPLTQGGGNIVYWNSYVLALHITGFELGKVDPNQNVIQPSADVGSYWVGQAITHVVNVKPGA